MNLSDPPSLTANPPKLGAESINDHWVIACASPIVGLGVATATGMLRHLHVQGLPRALGLVVLAAIAFCLWHGNRAVFFGLRSRLRPGWEGRRLGIFPGRLVLVMVSALLFSVPMAYGLLLGWHAVFTGLGAAWESVHAAVALIAATSLFLSYAYESILLSKEKAWQLEAMSQLQRLHRDAELHTLEAQLDPHFMYNALCSVGFLIETDQERASAYIERLAAVYGYVTRSLLTPLVPLAGEIALAQAYVALLKLRHAETLRVVFTSATENEERLVVPMSIQLGLENATKHNDLVASEPLQVEVRVLADLVEVRNQKRARALPAPSLGVGLKNLSMRCRLSIGRDIEVVEDAESFCLRVPLLLES